MDTGEKKSVHELNDLAASVGFTDGKWPYGPNVDLDSRRAMVDWALNTNMRHVSLRSRGCLHWLLDGRTRVHRCDEIFHMRGFAGLWECGIELTYAWLDHISTWESDEARLFVAQPYSVTDQDREALVLLGSKPGLTVTIDDAGGWYGNGTVWISIRCDNTVAYRDPVPVCLGCGAQKARWYIHVSELEWYCSNCYSIVDTDDGDAAVVSDDPHNRMIRGYFPWLTGPRKTLTQWMRMAQFLHDAQPN